MNNPDNRFDINSDIRFMKGVGPKVSSIMEKMGIETIGDLLRYVPFRYINRKMTVNEEFEDGRYVTLVGSVSDTGEVRTRNRKLIFTALVKYEGGYLYSKWFNNRYIKNNINKGDYVVLSGVIRYRKGVFEMHHPEYEKFESEDAELIHTGRIVPVYHMVAGLSQKYFRRIMKNAVDSYSQCLQETLPEEYSAKYELKSVCDAVRNLHFPESEEMLESAILRMKHEELFYAGLRAALLRVRRESEKTARYILEPEHPERIKQSLPFELTGDQKRALDEIRSDMMKKYPMNRMLMGDVGSGKTVVALLSMLHAVESGYQAAIMAPTEILARQHYDRITNILNDDAHLAVLLTSASKEKDKIKDQISKGEKKLIIGTHALIQENIVFSNLSYIVIDEQHRFGVEQRSILKEKGVNPDYLMMSATPIPRTLAMTAFSGMDISSLNEKPSGRKDVKTKWIARADEENMYRFVAKLIKRGEKCFILCPSIEENEKSELESVEKIYKEMTEGPFRDFRAERMHSRVPQALRASIMEKMNAGTIDIIVSTTVVEVGIDIKEATSIIIFDANRFGLSQLHQLRGRVGRGEKESFCFLLTRDELSQSAVDRLRAFVSVNDGFKLAEMDLKQRGPGEFWGSRQHGIPQFSFTDYFEDRELILEVFRESEKILRDDLNLLKKRNGCVKIEFKRRYSNEID